jgi:rhamnosyltransferase subunit B
MAKIFLLPHGTAGDVLPYIWMGRQLRERGHHVTMIWVESFQAAAEAAGLDYQPMMEAGFEELLRNPALWQPHKGLQVGFAYAGDCMGKYLDAFATRVAREGTPDMLVAPHINFAARLLREKHRVPLISVVLYPMAFISAYEIAGGMLAARWLRLLPVVIRRIILSTVMPYDRFAMPQVRRQCLEHGVRPPRNLQRDWWLSPDGVLALFPSWYGKRQPDWPANCLQWDFPLEDLSVEKPLPSALAEFLDAGDRPVVFTLGTGNLHSRAFFETAVELCSLLGCRGVFVTRDRSQAPASLPPSICVATYAPFGALLPRVRVFVHHGGIGTLAQCFKAGVPQFIVSMNFDQPDNAERLERFNAGVGLDIRKFTVKRALPLLRRCLEDEGIRRGAAACAERVIQDRPPVTQLVQWLESRMQPRQAAPLQ